MFVSRYFLVDWFESDPKCHYPSFLKIFLLFAAPPVVQRDWAPLSGSSGPSADSNSQLCALNGRRMVAEMVYATRPLLHLLVSHRGDNNYFS